jgi:hypothetical protein
MNGKVVVYMMIIIKGKGKGKGKVIPRTGQEGPQRE